MSQYELINILIKEPGKWFDIDELRNLYPRSDASLDVCILALRKYGEAEVNYINVDKHHPYRRKKHVRLSPSFYAQLVKEGVKL